MADTLGPVRLLDPRSPWHSQVVYLHLSEGGIAEVQPTSAPTDWWVSPGWVDLLSWSSQPHRPAAESLRDLTHRAKQGGFTTLGVGGWEGWTTPELLAQLSLSSEALSATLLWIGAWATAEGTITPVESLHREGAIGWSLPPPQPIPWRTLAQALPYLRYLGGPIYLLPFWSEAPGTLGVPEAEPLSLSGWEGTPSYAETAAIHLIGTLWRHYGGQVAVGPLTTAEGLRLAQEYGLVAFTAPPYLLTEASQLLHYDPFWKIHPPLRTQADQTALQEALIKGKLLYAAYDFFAPPEDKQREWTTASIGQPTLTVAAPLLWEILRAALPQSEALIRFFSLLSEKPRQLLGLPTPILKAGHPVDLTLFQIRETPTPLPYPWHAYESTLSVKGTVRCLADLRSLHTQTA